VEKSDPRITLLLSFLSCISCRHCMVYFSVV